jgi:Coenzyme Q (ubiquinone) biosynthesis protein Coq4
MWQLIAGPAQLSAGERRVRFRDLAPWAAKAGSYAVDFLAVRYEDHLHRHLNDVGDNWSILSTKYFHREVCLLYKKRKKRGTPDDEVRVRAAPRCGYRRCPFVCTSLYEAKRLLAPSDEWGAAIECSTA